jgi:hypothetical protein
VQRHGQLTLFNNVATAVKHVRRIADFRKHRRIVGRIQMEQFDPEFSAAREFQFCLLVISPLSNRG